jgi:imidazolonepropionase-like amidohydrolase
MSSLLASVPLRHGLAVTLALTMTAVSLGCGGSGGAPSSPALSGPTAPPKATLAFANVAVFDGEQRLPEATVLVDGGKIVAVTPGGAVPPGAEVIDGRGKTLLPGLIDAHAHVFERSALQQSLAFGVTTVLDMFSAPDVLRGLRADPALDPAELRSAGILATSPGGHGTQYGFAIPTLTRPEQAQAWVDARLAEGSDYIKIVFDDGRAYKRKVPTLDVPTLAAVIAAAHARGKLAVVHIGDQASARIAIEQGADGLVHLFRDSAPTADLGKLTAARKAFAIATLVVTQGLYGAKSTIGKDPLVIPFLDAAGRASLATEFPSGVAKGPAGAAEQTIAQLRDAGVDLLAGTDAPNPGTAFGASLHEELSLLVAAGLSPAQALTAATAAPARRFGLDDRGRLAAGKRADLLLVDGDPTADIAATRKIAGIWRGGQRFDRAAYGERITAATRAAQESTADGSALGVISDFESSATAVRGGQPWMVSTDTMIGGTSQAVLALARGGARGSKGALDINGQLVQGMASWAGAMWMPGPQPFEPLDLSSKQGFTFQARGDGKTYTVMLFTKRGGRMPSMTDFKPGKAFAPVSFTWSQFGNHDGSDVTAILVGQTKEAGPFRLLVDDFEVK